jgi:hypothetical protein
MALCGLQCTHIVEKREISSEKHNRLGLRRSGSERARNHAVDSIGAAIREYS